MLEIPLLKLAKTVLGWALPALAALHPDVRVRKTASELSELLFTLTAPKAQP